MFMVNLDPLYTYSKDKNICLSIIYICLILIVGYLCVLNVCYFTKKLYGVYYY